MCHVPADKKVQRLCKKEIHLNKVAFVSLELVKNYKCRYNRYSNLQNLYCAKRADTGLLRISIY